MIGAARMDLDGDGDGVFDEDDLAVAQEAFWTEQPVLPSVEQCPL